MKNNILKVTILSSILSLFLLFPIKILAAEITLLPNTTTTKRLTPDVRYLNYVITIDKNGYQYLDFKYLDNGINLIGKGFHLEIRNKEKKLIHEAFEITSQYTTPTFGFKKGDTVYLNITEDLEYLDSGNGADLQFTFFTIKDNYYETEENNDYETSNLIENNMEMKGNFHVSSDEDFYKYKIPSSGETSFYFSVDQKNLDKIKDGFKIEVLDSNKNIVNSYNNIFNNSVFSNFKYKKGEVLFIKVSVPNYRNAPIGLNYGLKALSKLSDTEELEQNNSFKTANKIKKQKNGFLSSEEDVDYFVFRSSKTKTYKISFRSDNVGNDKFDISLYTKKKGKRKKIQNKIVGESKTFSVKLKKGNNLWIGLKGSGTSAPTFKDYTIKIR